MTALTMTARRVAFPAGAVAVTCLVTAAVLRLGTTSFRRYGATLAVLAGVALLIRARQATRVGMYCVYIALIPALNAVREVATFRAGELVVTPATAFLAVVLVLGAGHRADGVGRDRRRQPWLLPVACLALVVLSGLVATVLASSLYDRPVGLATSLWIDGVLLPALVFAGIVTARPRRAELVMVAKAIVMAAMLSVVLGLMLNAAGGEVARSVNSEGNALIRVGLLRTRATFTFGNPDQFALVGSLAVPIAAMLAVSAKRAERLWWSAAFVTLVVANVYTFSRGGIIAVVLSLLVAAWYDERARRIALAVGAATLVLAVAVPSVGRALGARFTQEEVFESEPVRDRQRAIDLGLRTVVTTPLGIGAGAFRDVWRDAGYSEPALQSPHNLVLGVAVEYGAVAGLAFLVWLGSCWRLVRRRLRRRADADPVQLGLAAGALAFLVTGTLTGADLSHLAGAVPLATQTVLFVAAVASAVAWSTADD